MVWIFSYTHAHSNQECVLVTQQPRMYVIYKAIEQEFQFVLIIKANWMLRHAETSLLFLPFVACRVFLTYFYFWCDTA